MIKNNKKTILLALILIFGFITFISFTPMVALADPPKVSTVAGSEAIKNIMLQIVPWFDSACVLALAISIIQLVISKDQKAVNGTYKYITMIISVFLVFNLLGSIFAFVSKSVPRTSYDYENGSQSYSSVINNKT